MFGEIEGGGVVLTPPHIFNYIFISELYDYLFVSIQSLLVDKPFINFYRPQKLVWHSSAPGCFGNCIINVSKNLVLIVRIPVLISVVISPNSRTKPRNRIVIFLSLFSNHFSRSLFQIRTRRNFSLIVNNDWLKMASRSNPSVMTNYVVQLALNCC